MHAAREKTRFSCRSKSPENNERGFTLIETSIALVVMMVAALGAASLFTFAIKYNAGAYDRTLAIAIAQQQMEKLRNGSFDDVVSSSDSDVLSAGRRFTVSTTVTGTNLKSITVTVTPSSGADSWVRNSVIIVTQRSALGTGQFYQ